MNKEQTILITALVLSAVCISACGGAKKETTVSETSSVITTVSETTESSETEAATTAPDGETQTPETGSSDPSNTTVSAEYKAEVGASYPMRYENDAVYCHDPKTGEKKTGYIRINGIVYFFDPAMNGQLTDISVNDFFSKAVFIGNSTSEGLTTYFNSKGKDYLGGPLVAAKVSYTFNSDKSKLDGYMLKYKNEQLQAKELVKKCGAKRALIMMGTNDLMGAEASAVAEKYKKYIEGIVQENPGVVIYIQSTTPRRGTKNVESLSNDKINELNRLMMEYANSQADVYYIDISTPLTDADGNLKQSYSSDGYVHLNIEGYSVWVNRVVDYVRAVYLEKAADDAKASSQAS